MRDLKSRHPFEDATVAAQIDAYPAGLRADLLRLRELIFETAEGCEEVGALSETLKWGQPAYRPEKPRVGTTIRLGMAKNRPGDVALLFHCQTTLVADFRELYRDQFGFEGNRALVLAQGKKLPRDALRHCIALALTYHARK